MQQLSGYFVRFWKHGLRLAYGFDKWHTTSLDQRKYATDIIAYGNGRERKDKAAEIGCGLGDIIRHLQYRIRTGYDQDPKVLKAASFLSRISGQSIQYKSFNFPDSVLEGSFDLIIMVNWIHHIDPDLLKFYIEKYFGECLLPGAELLIDTVQDPEYRVNHNIQFLTKDLNCSIYRLGMYPREREVWAVKKIR